MVRIVGEFRTGQNSKNVEKKIERHTTTPPLL